MLIKEVCTACGLTKKAIEYYEHQGLIAPQAGENGYRIYTAGDVSVLKEIALLRRLDIGTAEIRNILQAADKTSALKAARAKTQFALQRTAQVLDCIDRLIGNYNIDETARYVDCQLEPGLLIREKLLQVFPGSYGTFLCTHFGAFLNEPLDSEEKQSAYRQIVEFLDTVELPEDLEQILSEYQSPSEQEILDMQQSIRASVADAEAFVENNRAVIEQYLAYRNSQEYKDSPASGMQQALLAFNQTCGYYDCFIPNIKLLSRSYRDYMDSLEAANQALLRVFPEAAALYPEK